MIIKNLRKGFIPYVPLPVLLLCAIALAEYHNSKPGENYHCDKLSGKRFACVGGQP